MKIPIKVTLHQVAVTFGFSIPTEKWRCPKSQKRVGCNLTFKAMLTDIYEVNENAYKCSSSSGCCDTWGYGCSCACNNS